MVQESFGQEGMELKGRPLWPAGPALTARLRRLITAYQRFMRREPLRHDFLLPEGLGAGLGTMSWQLGEEIRRCTVAAAEPDPLFLEWQRRWVMSEQRWVMSLIPYIMCCLGPVPFRFFAPYPPLCSLICKAWVYFSNTMMSPASIPIN